MQNNVNYLPKRRCKGFISILVSDWCTSREKPLDLGIWGGSFHEVQLDNYTLWRWEKAIKGKHQSDPPLQFHLLIHLAPYNFYEWLLMTTYVGFTPRTSLNMKCVCGRMFQLVGTSFKCFCPTLELIHNL